MDEDLSDIPESHEIGIHKRHFECHVIEQVMKFIAQEEQRRGDVSQKHDERDRLIPDEHHEQKGKAENKNKRGYADEERIKEIRHRMKRHV